MRSGASASTCRARVLNGGNITFTKVIQNAFPVTSAMVPRRSPPGPAALPFVVAGSAAQATWSKAPTR